MLPVTACQPPFGSRKQLAGEADSPWNPISAQTVSDKGNYVNPTYCAVYNLTQRPFVAPFVILTLQGLMLGLKEDNNGRVHRGTTIQAGVFTIHL